MPALDTTPPPTPPARLPTTLAITPWPDPVLDQVGFDPRSAYVEQFWLAILGPSTTFLVRRLGAGLDAEPEGFDLPLADTAQAIGIGTKGGRNSPFLRALGRTTKFGLAQHHGGGLAVRRKVPPLNRHQLERLPASLQDAHADWQANTLAETAAEQHRRRARRLALSLFELGEDLEATERQLHRWRFHPALARDAAVWASGRHHEALDAAKAATAGGGGGDLGGDAA